MVAIKEPITLREAGQLHYEWLDEMRGLPEGTRRQQRAAYNTLAAWLEGFFISEAMVTGCQLVAQWEPMTTDWTGDTLDLYFRKYVSGQKSWDTKRQQTILAERWMMQQGYLLWGPPITEARIPRRGYTPSPARDRRLTDDEVLQLAAAGGMRHARNYFMILFARLTGRRVSEIVALKWVDVLWKDGDIRWVNIKAGGKRRLMPLTPEVRALLEAWKIAYANDVRAAGVPVDWYIFPATKPTGIARRGMHRTLQLCPESPIGDANEIINDALKRAGLKAEVGDAWHLLRKSAVNKTKQSARASGRADALELAQHMADHASPATTGTYISDDEDYQASKAWHMTTRQLGNEALRSIPALAALVQDAKNEPASESDASPVDQVYRSDNVLDFASRRRRYALG